MMPGCISIHIDSPDGKRNTLVFKPPPYFWQCFIQFQGNDASFQYMPILLLQKLSRKASCSSSLGQKGTLEKYQASAVKQMEAKKKSPWIPFVI